jgi:hypothetical protein
MPSIPITSSDQLRIIHLSGPGDATSVLQNMAQGEAADGIAHVAYSRQMFEVCRQLGAHLISWSTHRRSDDFSFGRLRAINRPDPLAGRSGLGFHWANVEFARQVRVMAAEFGANMVIAAPTPYPFLLTPLAASGVRRVPALHAILWPEFTRASLARRVAARLSGGFFTRTCQAILSHPGGAVRRVHQLTHGMPSCEASRRCFLTQEVET